MKWTKEQEQVINLGNRNILVAAGAGSGKTAVLVQRIIRMITDEEKPVDIDHLLIVTFTKAAASEMRERIGAAIEERLLEHPEDENLQRQLTLLHHAQITTIDSFCLYVVRNHFEEISLDPNFRIADTGEITLLEMETMDELMEENYEAPTDAFLHLVDCYGSSTSNEKVKDMITKIYSVSKSAPWPVKWVKGLGSLYQATDETSWEESAILRTCAAYAKTLLMESADDMEKAAALARSEDGPVQYLETLEKEQKMLEAVKELATYEELSEFIAKLTFGRLPSIRNYSGDEAKKTRAVALRNEVKATVGEIQKKYFADSIADICRQMNRMSPDIMELIRLTIRYMERMDKKKRESRIADFSDIEHFALQILVNPDSGTITETAREFQNTFEEILIDEYQDSNQVQEEILCAISRMIQGQNNMFMVGDVKQSIYRFRQAKPELFMEKYKTYNQEESTTQRIDLHQNFRSRMEVIDYVNDIFYKIMGEDLGGVAYDKKASLKFGAQYFPDNTGMEPELLLINQKDELLEGTELGKKELEAVVIADRIEQILRDTFVTDKKTGELRRATCGDIVILLRSLKGFGQDFAEVLSERGIPAYVESSTGYFSAIEVQTTLAMLKILDNPYQDIPMAAVLKSPMVGLSEEELAEIRVLDRDKSFAENALAYCKEETEKTKGFYQCYENLRAQVPDTPIHTLIAHILKDTGYLDYVASMPAGERRYGNLRMLMEKAIAYQQTSYKGLFHFVRYIESLQKYDVDFGEADTTGESADVVRIMSIHKSKGLEFPIVFVAGLGKKFNTMDTRQPMVIHPELGIGLTEQTLFPRTKRNTMAKEQISNLLKLENLGEELRILYVALTRAKEKLILTGVISDYQKAMEGYTGEIRLGHLISYQQREGATTYLDWIVPAMMSYPNRYQIKPVDFGEVVVTAVKKQIEHQKSVEEVNRRIRQVTEDERQKLEEAFLFQYETIGKPGQKLKYSVSELKHMSMEQNFLATEQQAETPEFLKSEPEEIIPRFLSEKGADTSLGGDVVVNRGALRGTAVHRAMECMNFLPILNFCESTPEKMKAEQPEKLQGQMEEYVRDELHRMLDSKLLTPEMMELIQVETLITFMMNPVALEMARAQERGQLYREKPFIMDHQGVLVQGIIDVFWIKDDTLTVLDYKTDRVKKSEELVLRYQTQLELYKDALGRNFGTPETPMKTRALIYSFACKNVVEI